MSSELCLFGKDTSPTQSQSWGTRTPAKAPVVSGCLRGQAQGAGVPGDGGNLGGDTEGGQSKHHQTRSEGPLKTEQIPKHGKEK